MRAPFAVKRRTNCRALFLFLGITLALISWGSGQEEPNKTDETKKVLAEAEQLLRQGFPEQAAEKINHHYQSFGGIWPTEPFLCALLLAEANLRSGKFTPSLLAELDQNIPPDDPNRNRHSLLYGLALAKTGKYKQAIATFEKVSPDDLPLYKQSLLNIAQVSFLTNQPDTGLVALKKLKDQTGESSSTQRILLEIRLLMLTKQPQEALALFNETGNSLPPALALTRGELSLKLNQAEEALSAFRNVRQPSASPAQLTAALLGEIDSLIQIGNTKEAFLLATTPSDENSSPLSEADLFPRFESIFSKLTEEDKRSILQLAEESENKSIPVIQQYYFALSSEPNQIANRLTDLLDSPLSSSLRARALLQLARLALKDGDSATAQKHLEKIKTLNASPISTQADELLTHLHSETGDYQKAIQLIGSTLSTLSKENQSKAKFNLALLQIAQDPSQPLAGLDLIGLSNENQQNLSTHKALALAKQGHPDAIRSLRMLLRKQPTKDGAVEMRVALIESLLAQSNPPFEEVLSEIEQLPENLPLASNRQRFQLTHRYGLLTNQWEPAIKAGRKILQDLPSLQQNPQFLLRFAECHFRAENFSRAQDLFNKAADLAQGTPLSDIARLMQARSNLAIPTESATQQALTLLGELVEENGELAHDARLTKARTLLRSLSRPRECLSTLNKQIGEDYQSSLLAAEAYLQLAFDDPKIAEKAYDIYRLFLSDPKTNYPHSNQIHFLLGSAYRDHKQGDKALSTFLKVIDFENRPPDNKTLEWDYYYRCGFAALDLLLSEERPRAAYVIATKLAQTSGPRAKQANERAEQLRSAATQSSR